MNPDSCPHPRRAMGVIELDFARPNSSDSLYTARVSVGVCDDCGHIELYAQFHQFLTDWLRKL